MAVKKPICNYSGTKEELRAGDSIASTLYEPMLASGAGNLDVVYLTGVSLVPDFMLTTEGDLIMGVRV